MHLVLLARTTLLLGVAAVTLGCRRSAQTVDIWCPHRPEGTSSVRIQQAHAPRSAAADAQAGSLVVTVRMATGDHPPANNAVLSLHSDTTAASVGGSSRTAITDSSGVAVFPDIAGGTYGILVRRIGLEVIRHPIRVRPGYVDTIGITLAARPVCLTMGRGAT